MKQYLTKFAAVALVAGTLAIGLAAPAGAYEWRGRHGTYDRSSYVVVKDKHHGHDRHWNRGYDRYYRPPVYYRPAPPPVYYGPPPRVVYTQPYYYPPRSGTTYIFNWD